MNSRRSFIKRIGAGAALTTVAFSSSPAFNALIDSEVNDDKPLNQRPVKIGIIEQKTRTLSVLVSCST